VTDPEITTTKVESIFKLSWRTRFRIWRLMRQMRKNERAARIAAELAEEEHYRMLYGVCPGSGDACRGNCSFPKCDRGY